MPYRIDPKTGRKIDMITGEAFNEGIDVLGATNNNQTAQVPSIEQPKAKKSPLQFVKNLFSSGAKAIGDTASGLYSASTLPLAIGGIQKGINNVAPNTFKTTEDDKWLPKQVVRLGKGAADVAIGNKTQEAEMAKGVGKFYDKRFGISNLLKGDMAGAAGAIGESLYDDPVGMAFDIGTLLAAGGGAISKVGKLGKVEKLASAGGKIAQIGNAIDPLSITSKLLGKAKIPEGITKLGESVETRGSKMGLRATKATPMEVAMFEKKVGKAMDTVQQKYGLYGSEQDIIKKVDDTLASKQAKYNEIARTDIEVPITDYTERLRTKAKEMKLNNVSPEVNATADALIKRADEMDGLAGSGFGRDTSYRSTHQIDKQTALPVTELDNTTLNGFVENYKAKYGYPAFKQKQFATLKKLIENPTSEVTIYRASPKNELNSGDWVTTSKTYAQDIKRQNGGKVYEYKVKAGDLYYPKTAAGFEELPSLAKWESFQYSPASKTVPLSSIVNAKGASFKKVSPATMADAAAVNADKIAGGLAIEYLDTVAPGSKAIGKELQELQAFRSILEKSAKRGTTGKSLSIGKGMVGGGIGAAAGGIPGAVAGYIAEQTINAPKTASAVSQFMQKTGKGIQGISGLPIEEATRAGMLASRANPDIAEQEPQSQPLMQNNTSPVLGAVSGTQGSQPINERVYKPGETISLQPTETEPAATETDTITGYDIKTLAKAYIAAIGSGDSKSASVLGRLLNMEQEYQSSKVPKPTKMTEVQAKYASAYRGAEKALNLLESGNVDSGIVPSLIGKVTGKLGMKSATQIEYESALAQAVGPLLSALSGANVPPAEYERLKGMIPEISDAPITAKTKLIQLKAELENLSTQSYQTGMTVDNSLQQ